MIFYDANKLLIEIQMEELVQGMKKNHYQQKVINKAVHKYFLTKSLMWLKLDEVLKGYNG
jgi:hypothetical protein